MVVVAVLFGVQCASLWNMLIRGIVSSRATKRGEEEEEEAARHPSCHV